MGVHGYALERRTVDVIRGIAEPCAERQGLTEVIRDTLRVYMNRIQPPLSFWRTRHRVFLSGLLAGAFVACSDSNAPTPPPPPGISFVNLNAPADLTPDGMIALIEDRSSSKSLVYFYNVLTDQLDLKTRAGMTIRDFVTGISSDHRVTAHHGNPVEAGLWVPRSGWTDIASTFSAGCDENKGAAWDISADGHIVVGFHWDGCTTQAFRWSDAGGTGVLTPLQVLGSSVTTMAPVNRATVVSDDGTVAAGFAESIPVDRWPAIWRADGTGFLLPGGVFPADAPGEVLSISEDGTSVAGIWNLEGFYWTQQGGVVKMNQPSDPLACDKTFPNAMADTGKLIFGGCGDWFSINLPAAFVWTAADGVQSLQDVAAANGIDIPHGYLLTNVLAASADGTVVLGTAIDDQFNLLTFVLRLPVTAYGV